MADWSSRNIMLTTKGAAAISKVQSGSGKLTITKVVASEQYVSESTLREVTSLSVENLPLTIIDRHEVPDGGSVIQVQLNNLDLANPFVFNEIGVFATHSDNPSEEFLYIIAQVDADTGDRIPLYSTTPITATYDIYLYNVGADNIEVTISSSGLVTYEALNEACGMVKRSTSYAEGDIRYSSSLPIPYYLKCKVAGTTSSSSIVVPSDIEEGDTITDGTVVWEVIRLATNDALEAAVTTLNSSITSDKLALAESTGYGIVSGCEPSISGLTVTVGAGVIHLADGTRKEISASNITLDSADSTNPRIDLVYIDSTGTVTKVTGTASASPGIAKTPNNGILVTLVRITANATTGNLIESRDMLARYQNERVVNVKDFGAVGDGVADDTNAIQLALDFAANQHHYQNMSSSTADKGFGGYGGKVFIPNGIYAVSKTLNVNIRRVSICGDGNVMILGHTKNNPVMWLNGQDTMAAPLHRIVEGLNVRHSYGKVSIKIGNDTAGEHDAACQFTIRNCVFDHQEKALDMYSDAYLINIENCTFVEGRHALYINSGSTNIGENINVINCMFSEMVVPFHLDGQGVDIKIRGCSFDNFSIPCKVIELVGQAMVYIGECHIEQSVERSYNYLIDNSSNSDLTKIIIENNVISMINAGTTIDHAIHTEYTGRASNVHILHNKIDLDRRIKYIANTGNFVGNSFDVDESDTLAQPGLPGRGFLTPLMVEGWYNTATAEDYERAVIGKDGSEEWLVDLSKTTSTNVTITREVFDDKRCFKITRKARLVTRIDVLTISTSFNDRNAIGYLEYYVPHIEPQGKQIEFLCGVDNGIRVQYGVWGPTGVPDTNIAMGKWNKAYWRRYFTNPATDIKRLAFGIIIPDGLNLPVLYVRPILQLM